MFKDVLLFDNVKKLKDGLNMTVRRGTRWDALLPEKFYIQSEVKEEPSFVGKLVEKKVMRFEDLQQEDLSFCTKGETYEDVLQEMRIVYDDFDVYEIVTVIYFEVEE